MRGSNQLESVETIYEEECEFASPSLSPSFSSSPPSLHSTVKAWSLKIGHNTDVLIRVQGICFRLHKDRVVSQSSYLKRSIMETSDLTLPPSLKITAKTFAAVAEFCYNGRVQITPANVAVIRTAAELLGMTAGDGLSQVAETLFVEVVGSNEEQTSTVLRSCMPLLPEAETTACLVSRCIEALVSVHGVTFSRLNEVREMQPREFQIVGESMGRRLDNHDVLYKMVDLYLKENKFEKGVKEEERNGICNSIDCRKLSSGTLAECVKNPRMSMRLVVRAVLVEHLNTRHSISAQRHSDTRRRRSMTLADFLYRDAARGETARLRESMDSTDARIRSLEEEVRCMNKMLRECEGEGEDERGALGSERSVSFHFVGDENCRVKKGERWSVSSSRVDVVGSVNPNMSGTFRQRLMIGLKNAFRVPKSKSTSFKKPCMQLPSL